MGGRYGLISPSEIAVWVNRAALWVCVKIGKQRAGRLLTDLRHRRFVVYRGGVYYEELTPMAGQRVVFGEGFLYGWATVPESGLSADKGILARWNPVHGS